MANPAGMLRANAYATSKAALEAHTVNLAAELSGSGVTVNVFRPGGVDTAMQAWIRAQAPVLVGAALHERFVDNYEQGTLLSPERSACSPASLALTPARSGTPPISSDRPSHVVRPGNDGPGPVPR
jgi:NAD(P)-dependent dehydrogenase (short-subunit alcohol dehydrogenase family)